MEKGDGQGAGEAVAVVPHPSADLGRGPLEGAPAPRSERPSWQVRYLTAQAGADTAGAVLAVVIAQLVRFGNLGQAFNTTGLRVPYLALAVVAGALWTGILGISGAYDRRAVGAGAEEYRRLLEAGVRFLAFMALLSFVLATSVARSVVILTVPLAVALSCLGHHQGRRWLSRARLRGACSSRVVVVGPPSSATALARHLRQAPEAGLRVVAVRADSSEEFVDLGGEVVPVLRSREEILEAVRLGAADTVAVSDPSRLGPGGLRHLGWQLEGMGADLVVVPSATDVAGPRLRVTPVAGLPLVHVEEARFSGLARLVKGGAERVLAGLALVVMAPLFGAVALAVRASGPGPVLFRQVRVGRHGQPFTMLKFRTMQAGAESAQAGLAHLNEADGLLFKIRRDPRVTRVGRVLRRSSLDELPQLWHVVTGQMSIVGPRPPLPTEVERYGPDVRRRLLVKPGLTGLWQVSGRTDLPWEDAVRLDLHYVDNWSLMLDLVIVLKTLSAVVRGRGAY